MIAAPPQVSPEDYRALFRSHPAAVAVITLAGPSGPVGFTATSVVSVSADPTLILFSVPKGSSSWPALAKASEVVIHFLDEGDHALARRFALSGTNRFEGLSMTLLDGSLPLLGGVETWLRGRVEQCLPAGSSHLVLISPQVLKLAPTRQPLLYRSQTFHAVGAPVA